MAGNQSNIEGIEMLQVQEKAYEMAVKMYDREHDRWNSWVLFFFGTLVSIFLVWNQIKNIIPLWLPCLLSFILCIMWVSVSLSIRESTWAWRQTVFSIEKGEIEDLKPFLYCEQKLDEFNRWKDLCKTLKLWTSEPYKRITRLLTLLGIILGIFFLILVIYDIANLRSCGVTFPT
jgi:hypothetical protein